MLRTLEMDGYTLVTPDPDDSGWLQMLMDYSLELNQAYLDSLNEAPRGGKLTGEKIGSWEVPYFYSALAAGERS